LGIGDRDRRHLARRLEDERLADEHLKWERGPQSLGISGLQEEGHQSQYQDGDDRRGHPRPSIPLVIRANHLPAPYRSGERVTEASLWVPADRTPWLRG